jgi:RNA polymerase sigma-70 factor (ECF subfamily)
MTRIDDQWFLRLKAKDPEVFAETVKAHSQSIFKACLGLGFNKSEADDITQNVWMTFFDVVEKFEGRSSIRTFLFGILYNKASEHRRFMNRLEGSDDIEKIIDDHFDRSGHWIKPPLDPEQFMNSVETLNLIADCFERLPLNNKMAFNMKEVEGHSTEEICDTLKLTVSNLGVLLFRARNQLRECIEFKTQKGV